jgi:hypothetical protein
MSIRLCQECYQWFWSHEERCPQCQDPWLETINQESLADRLRPSVGNVYGRIGHVTITQKRLPSEGLLYETEFGLFFLPHRNVTVTRLVEEGKASPLWLLATMLWAPLMFVMPFIRAKRLTEKDVKENHPLRLHGDNLQRLPDLLGRMPGSIFIAARDVVSVKIKRKRWNIHRMSGGKLSIEPISIDAFGQRMEQIMDTDQWRSIFN